MLLLAILILAFPQISPVPFGRQQRSRRAATPNHRTVVIKAGDNFQLALDRARPGDTLSLQAAATFVGPFTLPQKQGEGYITIQSSRLNEFPQIGTRVSPVVAELMPKIVTPGKGASAIMTENGAHHYRLIGLEITGQDAASFSYDLIALGDSDQSFVGSIPHDLIIDRCFIHAVGDAPMKRGVALNSANTEIANSYISGFKLQGQDSQAIAGWSGPGPFKILNNYIEGAGDNLIFGGAAPKIKGLVPSDIEIRGNTFFKPLAWKENDPHYAGIRWSVKNLLEFKSARRVVIDANVFENNWAQSQAGFAILFTVGNDSGAWAQIEDVQFTNNILRNSTNGINIRGMDDVVGSGVRRVAIRNNLIESVNGNPNGQGIFLQLLRGTEDVTVDHNTIFNSGNFVMLDEEKHQRLTVTNNIARHNYYGVFGNGGYLGTTGLDRYVSNWTFARNVLAGADASRYPRDNFYPVRIDPTIFVNFEAGDYRLSPGTKGYKGRGANGKDIGCDIDQLISAMASVAIMTVK